MKSIVLLFPSILGLGAHEQQCSDFCTCSAILSRRSRILGAGLPYELLCMSAAPRCPVPGLPYRPVFNVKHASSIPITFLKVGIFRTSSSDTFNPLVAFSQRFVFIWHGIVLDFQADPMSHGPLVWILGSYLLQARYNIIMNHKQSSGHYFRPLLRSQGPMLGAHRNP